MKFVFRSIIIYLKVPVFLLFLLVAIFPGGNVFSRQDSDVNPSGIVYPPGVMWSRDGMWHYQKVITLGLLKDSNLSVPGAVDVDAYAQDLGNGLETFVMYRWRGSEIAESKNQLDFFCESMSRGFFMLKTPYGVGYTRDGRFKRDENFRLVSVAGNFPVIGYAGDIYVPWGYVAGIPNGSRYVDGDKGGRIRIAVFKNRETLWTINGSVFFNDGEPELIEGEKHYKVRQYFVEASSTIKGLKGEHDSAMKAYEGNAKAVKTNLKVMKSAIRISE